MKLRPLPEQALALIEDAEDAWDEGAWEEAIDLCEQAARAAPGIAEPHLYVSDYWSALGRPDRARRAAARAAELEPEATDVHEAMGFTSFELGDLPEAERWLVPLARAGSRKPAVHFCAGVLLERGDRRGEADAAFGRAAKLEPAYRFVEPMTREEFDGVVEEAIEELPPFILDELQNVSVQVEDFLAIEDLEAGELLSPMSLGLFRGPNRDQQGFFDGVDLPPAVLLYQRALELTCRTDDELVEQIRITLHHEIGHYLGLDEDDLDERGIGAMEPRPPEGDPGLEGGRDVDEDAPAPRRPATAAERKKAKQRKKDQRRQRKRSRKR